MRALHQSITVFAVPQVTGQGHGLAPGFADQGDDLPRIRFFLRQVGDRHVRPLTGIGDGSRPANTGIATRNQRLASRQPAGPPIAGFPMVGSWRHLPRKAGPGLRLLGKRRAGIGIFGVHQRGRGGRHFRGSTGPAGRGRRDKAGRGHSGQDLATGRGMAVIIWHGGLLPVMGGSMGPHSGI